VASLNVGCVLVAVRWQSSPVSGGFQRSGAAAALDGQRAQSGAL